MPAKLLANIPPIGSTSEQSDPMLYVKWFTSDANWTWYVNYSAYGINDVPVSKTAARMSGYALCN